MQRQFWITRRGKLDIPYGFQDHLRHDGLCVRSDIMYVNVLREDGTRVGTNERVEDEGITAEVAGDWSSWGTLTACY